MAEARAEVTVRADADRPSAGDLLALVEGNAHDQECQQQRCDGESDGNGTRHDALRYSGSASFRGEVFQPDEAMPIGAPNAAPQLNSAEIVA